MVPRLETATRSHDQAVAVQPPLQKQVEQRENALGISLVDTQDANPWIRHCTWTRIGESHFRRSLLQNQFALAEWVPPLSEAEALSKYRSWLWKEMQDEQNVVWREMSELINAHERGEVVVVMVPKGSKHGEILVRALGWMVQNTREVLLPRIVSTSPGPNHEPILPDGTITTHAPIEPKHLVWVHGNQQSRIGVISEWSVAFVPEYGEVPLIPGRFHWVDRELSERPQFQALLSDALDAAFEQEADQSPPEYDPVPRYLDTKRYDETFEEIQLHDEQQRSLIMQAALDDLSPTLFDDLLQETEDVVSIGVVAQMREEVLV